MSIITDIIAPKTNLQLTVGLFFGTFNPIHIGHLAVANYMVEYSCINQLWFVVSPQNPFKKKSNLLDNYQRLEMVHRAVDSDFRFRVSDIEFNMPKPSYTIDTLTYLKEKYPNYKFMILMGADNIEDFHKWKNYKQILDNYGILVYPRPGFDHSKVENYPNVSIINAPMMEVSSSFIRNAIREGKDIRYYVPPKTWEYIDDMNFYR
jgi:nicotinate-nucleotide adenylyltransferase